MICKRRDQIINDTRIKYLSVGDKLYAFVNNIDFRDLKIEARETDLDVSDVAKEGVFPIEDFGEFKITLRNGVGRIVDFRKWMKRNGKFCR